MPEDHVFQTVDPRDTTVTRSAPLDRPGVGSATRRLPRTGAPAAGPGGQPDHQRHQQRRRGRRQRDAGVVDGAPRAPGSAAPTAGPTGRRTPASATARPAPPAAAARPGCAAGRPGRTSQTAATIATGSIQASGLRSRMSRLAWPLRLTTVHASPVSTCSTNRPRWLRSAGGRSQSRTATVPDGDDGGGQDRDQPDDGDPHPRQQHGQHEEARAARPARRRSRGPGPGAPMTPTVRKPSTSTVPPVARRARVGPGAPAGAAWRAAAVTLQRADRHAARRSGCRSR